MCGLFYYVSFHCIATRRWWRRMWRNCLPLRLRLRPARSARRCYAATSTDAGGETPAPVAVDNWTTTRPYSQNMKLRPLTEKLVEIMRTPLETRALQMEADRSGSVLSALRESGMQLQREDEPDPSWTMYEEVVEAFTARMLRLGMLG